MRNQVAWLICVLVLVVGGFATSSLTRGQGPSGSTKEATLPPITPPTNGLKPSSSTVAAGETPESTKPPSPTTPTAPLVPSLPELGAYKADPTPLSQQQQIEFGARRGAEWLFRMNDVKGHFVHGMVPALNTVLEGDHFLRQVGAACTLARACAAYLNRRPRILPRKTCAKVTQPAPPGSPETDG